MVAPLPEWLKEMHSKNSGDTLLYTASVRTTGGRDYGVSRSSDGRLGVELSIPGAARIGTNPEQLLAAGWSTCFESAIGIAARSRQIALPVDLTIDAEIDLRHGESGYFLNARLNVSLPSLESAVAQALVDQAHRICPYSTATQGNVDVVINLA